MSDFVLALRKDVERMVKYGTRDGALKGWEKRRRASGKKPVAPDHPNLVWAKQFAPKGEGRGGGTKRFVIERENRKYPDGKTRENLNLRLPKVAADRIMRQQWKSTLDPAKVLAEKNRVWKGYETVKDLRAHGQGDDSKIFALNALIGATNGRIKAFLEEAARTPKWNPMHQALMYKAEKLMAHRDKKMIPAKSREWEALQPGGFGKSLGMPKSTWELILEASQMFEDGEEFPAELLNKLENIMEGYDGN